MEEKERRGIQSVEIGSELLLALARHSAPMALKDVARAAGMSSGKAHPYLMSFLKVKFVTQTPTGAYELGPLALQIGLARLQRVDPVKEASTLVEQLAESTGQSMAVAVWGNLGPTIVRLEEPLHPIHINLRVGTVMSVPQTATGRLFAAYLPTKVVEQFLSVEGNPAATGGRGPVLFSQREIDLALAEIREHGLSRTIGQPTPGVSAFSAPVFDSEGHIVLAITAMGPQATFDSEWEGEIATALRVGAAEISRRLGHVEWLASKP